MRKMITLSLVMLICSMSFARGYSSRSSSRSYSRPSRSSSFKSSYSRPKTSSFSSSSYSRPKSSTKMFSSSKSRSSKGFGLFNKSPKTTKSGSKSILSRSTKKAKTNYKPKSKVSKKYKKRSASKSRTTHKTIIHHKYTTRTSYYNHRTSFYGGYHNPYMGNSYYHQSYGMFDSMWLIYMLNNMQTNNEMRMYYYNHRGEMDAFRNSKLVMENQQLKSQLAQADAYAGNLQDAGVTKDPNYSVEGSEFATANEEIDSQYKNAQLQNQNIQMKDRIHNDKIIIITLIVIFTIAMVVISCL